MLLLMKPREHFPYSRAVGFDQCEVHYCGIVHCHSTIVVNLDFASMGCGITMETIFWACLWGYTD